MTGLAHTTQETRTRREWWPALILFLFAMVVFFAREPGRAGEATTLGAAALFAVLTGLTLALSVTAVRERLRTRSQAVNVLVAPLAITAAIALCCAVIGLPMAPRAAAYGAYLTVPAVLVCVGRGRIPDTVRVLAAAIVLWLPIEFNLLPQLRLPPPDGLRAAPFAALAAGLYVFLVACPLERIGYTFDL